jgi:hypothetical protein
LAQQNLNVGTNPNDGTGDPVRTAMIKVQNNFSDLYTNYVSNAQLIANLASYQTLAGLAANVITVTSNSTNYVGSVSAANVVSNAQLAANLTGYVSAFQLSNNLANYQTTAGLSANVALLTSNNSIYLNGAPANAYVNTSGNYTFSGSITHNGNLVIGTSISLTANGSYGASGQVLTSNGSAVYWSTVGVNTAAQYTFTNTITHNGNLVIGTAAGLSANGGIGTAGQILTSNGTTAYWSSTANSANYIGSLPAANVVSNAQLAANLTSYPTSFQLSQNLANYALLSGATFTGSISATSLTVNNSVTVSGTVSSGYINVNSQTSGYTVANSDSGKVITVSSSSTVTITVPAGLPVGFRTIVTQLGTANVVLSNSAGLIFGSRTGNYTLSNTYTSASLLMTNSSFAVIDGAI